MEIKIAIGILQRHNRWRRGEDVEPMINPTDLGIDIDTVVDNFKNNVMCDCEDKDYSIPEVIEKKCFQCKNKIGNLIKILYRN